MSRTERDAKERGELVRAIRDEAARVAGAGPALVAHGERVARALATATRKLVSNDDTLGFHLREALAASTGLSPEMIAWALREALGSVDEASLLALRARAFSPWRPNAIAAPVRLAVAVLAGNVFTASYKAMAFPLLVGAPVVAKAPSADDTFPRFFRDALRASDPVVGDAVSVLTFPGGEHDLEDALFAQADCVSVYGSNATIRAVRERLSGTTDFVPHGHGLGLAYVGASAVSGDASLRELVHALAIDVAAYDQRGCMSPHAVFIDAHAGVDARTFAQALAQDGLARLERELPRGPLDGATQIAQMQWRGVAGARGEIFDGGTFAVSFEADSPLRLSSGHRNVAVYGCENAEDFVARVQPLGTHLKTLAVAGEPLAIRSALDRAATSLCPRVCRPGEMQRPPLDALADGQPPFAGLLRWRDG